MEDGLRRCAPFTQRQREKLQSGKQSHACENFPLRCVKKALGNCHPRSYEVILLDLLKQLREEDARSKGMDRSFSRGSQHEALTFLEGLAAACQS